jgi:hypothetical protein
MIALSHLNQWSSFWGQLYNYDETFRFRQPHRNGTYMNFTPGSRMEILDPYTARFLFPEPDGAALVKISNMHMANRQFHREFGWGEKKW